MYKRINALFARPALGPFASRHPVFLEHRDPVVSLMDS